MAAIQPNCRSCLGGEELWSFFCPRTHHLANTLALALGEPSPYPALFWHPGQRTFKS